MSKETTSNQREIAVQLNNAVAATLRPARLGVIPEARLKKLHLVAKALIAPAQELLEPDPDIGGSAQLEPEELVAVLAVAAMYVQLQNVMKTMKVPFAGLSKEVFESEG